MTDATESVSNALHMIYSIAGLLSVSSVTQREGLTSATIREDLLISPFSAVHFCFLYFDAILWNPYTFRLLHLLDE